MKSIQEYIKYSQRPILESLDEVQDYSVFLNVFNNCGFCPYRTSLE
jgi:hypothetical protein